MVVPLLGLVLAKGHCLAQDSASSWGHPTTPSIWSLWVQRPGPLPQLGITKNDHLSCIAEPHLSLFPFPVPKHAPSLPHRCYSQGRTSQQKCFNTPSQSHCRGL
jgi:hypothetical protein